MEAVTAPCGADPDPVVDENTNKSPGDTMKRPLTILISAGAAGLLLLPACAKDDKADAAKASTTTKTTAAKAASATDAKFCDAVLAGDQLFASSEQPDPAKWDAIVATLKSSTPDEVSGQIDYVITETTKMVQGAAVGSGPSEEYLQKLDEVHKWMAGNCGWPTVEATAKEYAFTGIPDTVDAGDVVLALTNDGKEVHEMNVMRINDGVTESIDDLLKLPEEEAQTKTTQTGSAFAVPGTTGYAAATLKPGRYAVVCFIPQGTTPDKMDAMQSGEASGTPHAMMGMHTEFTVS
jgi:hypothetical protein